MLIAGGRRRLWTLSCLSQVEDQFRIAARKALALENKIRCVVLSGHPQLAFGFHHADSRT